MAIVKQVFIGMLFILGSAVGLLTFMLQTITLSDIPVKFTAAEAIVIQILYFVSTLLLVFGIISIPSRAGNGAAILIFTAVFLFNINVLDRQMWKASYDPALVQLQLAPVLHVGAVIAVALFMFLLHWRGQPASAEEGESHFAD